MMSVTSSRTPGSVVNSCDDALDLHGGHCCALERGEQHAAERVAERVAEAAVERLDREHAAVLVGLFGDDPGNLEVHQA